MFGKKNQPLPPFVLQVLTTEYLIEGTVDGNTKLYFQEPETLDSIPSNSVPFKSSRPGWRNAAIQTCAQFAVWGDNTVAFLPRVEVTQMAQYETWSIFKKPLRGVFYFGSYLVQGTLMRLADQFLRN